MSSEATRTNGDLDSSPFESLSVLCVDDRFMVKVYKTMFDSLGCKSVTTVTGNFPGEQALAHIRRTHFDVLFTSFMLPDLPGFVIAEELHRIDEIFQRAPTPVLVVTGVFYKAECFGFIIVNSMFTMFAFSKRSD